MQNNITSINIKPLTPTSKSRNTIRIFFICPLTVGLLFILIFISSCTKNERHETSEAIENELKPNDWFFRQRASPQGQINKTAYIEALRFRETMKSKQEAIRDDLPEWIQCGPVNIGGRLVDVEMPLNNMQTIYVGAAAGGIFRSLNLGQTWDPIFDDQPTLSIGDIAIAPSDPNQIYVGTGEANAGGGSLAYDGLGVFKSIDAGDSWTDVGLTNVGSIGKVLVDPVNPERVYVAAMGDLFGNNSERGVFLTEDGGTTWEQTLFVNDSTGAIDLAIHPQNGDIVYAATWERIRRPDFRKYGGPGCGIYKTTNGGDTWTEIIGTGLPSNNKGRIGIAIANSNPDILYAVYADQSGDFNNVYKSTDAGDNWTAMPNPPSNNLYSSYGWWFGKIFVDPTDEDVLFLLGLDIFRSQDGASSWLNVSAGSSIHVDQHSIFIHPQNPDLVLAGNDGGMYISDQSGDSGSWQHSINLPITQFYTCEVDEQNPERLYGGTQDNSSMRTTSGNVDDWEVIYFGDGFVALVDPEDNSFVYTEFQYGNFARSTSGGTPFSFSSAVNGISNSDRKNWNTPVIFDPLDPAILYYGSQKLYRSTNHAASWTAISDDLTNGGGSGNLTFGTLNTIAVSPADSDIIYTGADDGSVRVTTNGGIDWNAIDEDLPKRWISKIAAHPANPMVAYITLSGYRYNDPLSHVFKTSDQGVTWIDISSNLPDVPVNDIIIDPENEGWCYIATDIGVFVSFTDGGNWVLMGDGLPNVPIIDIRLHNPTRTIVAATYGRSMYKAGIEDLTTIKKAEPSNELVNLNIYPNPIDPSSKIYLDLFSDQTMQMAILDTQGKLIAMVFEGQISTGKHVFDLPVINTSSTYFCVVKTLDKTISKTIVKIN